MMSSERTLDLLDPPTLVKALKDAAHAKAASDADADAYTVATVRTALEAAEKSVALLRAQLIVVDSDDTNDEGNASAPPHAKRQAVGHDDELEDKGEENAAAASSA